ncbi:MAG TPA: nucleotide exchange factor GrpE, partial [Bacteroidales bacterium]|nr:nucleotide exchange factor GrpE [Bacteroidales bacterium]
MVKKKKHTEDEQQDQAVNQEIESNVDVQTEQSTENTTEQNSESSTAIDTESNSLEKQLAELQDKHIRLHAEFDNFRRRTLKEKADLIKTGGEKTILDLLPVIDDLELAHKSIQTAQDIDAVKEGVIIIINKF